MKLNLEPSERPADRTPTPEDHWILTQLLLNSSRPWKPPPRLEPKKGKTLSTPPRPSKKPCRSIREGVVERVDNARVLRKIQRMTNVTANIQKDVDILKKHLIPKREVINLISTSLPPSLITEDDDGGSWRAALVGSVDGGITISSISSDPVPYNHFPVEGWRRDHEQYEAAVAVLRETGIGVQGDTR
ncbi:hypothetical protein M422DRAFT_253985 [Sphaerobolus stellatus SS14]|uniref:Uncharacterized protein n=1 Tax=Sphaerobolus stellatus (strain SS14) TaxID=990650 RepID=A0A0C9VWY1_SPHS4|nr:hypothetical protein M422DRAFT_253985 [Sphaerobolus stellatus SS14]